MASADQATGLSRVAGVMTGTSMDAIDVAILSIGQQVTLGQIESLIRLDHFGSRPLDRQLVTMLMALQQPGEDELHRQALASNTFADAVSRTILETLTQAGLTPKDISAVGVHGQTVRHRPELGYTIQLNAPARIAETTGIRVVSDFRSRDIAAQGQGAPLVPAFHRAIFSQHQDLKAVVNIGGIANLTWLGSPLIGFDTGPGNCLMDLWMQRHRGESFDRNGAWAASGKCHEPLLSAMQSDPFFAKRPPKSTGRDLFSMQWLDQHLAQHRSLATEDVQATLLMLTAETIAQAIIDQEKQSSEKDPAAIALSTVAVCGGGAQNPVLMKALSDRLSERLARSIRVSSTAHLGWDPQVIEASAFAWLAYQTLNGAPGNCPEVTGALGPRILGSITPA